MAVKIITDSTCDIPVSMQESLGIEIVPLKVLFGEREYIDGVELTNDEFYKMLRAAEKLPGTVQVNPDAFERVFEQHINAGHEVLGIFISGELSGTYQSAQIARSLVDTNNIHIVDSRNVSFGLAVLVYEAIRQRDAGGSAAEIADRLEQLKGRLVLYGAVDTLKYLKKGGRLSSSAALLGGLLSIKPIVSVENGKVVSAGKARGQAAAYQWMADRVIREQPDCDYDVVFAHSDAPEACTEFRKFICGGYPIKKYREMVIGSVVGTHAGPGCVGISYIRSTK